MQDIKPLLSLFKKKTVSDWARQCGFILRQRKLKAYDFLVLMTFGTGGMHHPSLAGMVDAIRSKMSREALHLRFSSSAISFMQRCVAFVLKQQVNAMAVINSDLLNHFNNIKIFDSTSWDIKSSLHALFPGCGGTASSANCKVQLCYEYLRGALSFFEITPGNKPDNRYAQNLPKHINSGDLLIADLGYFCLEMLKSTIECGAYFLFRFLVGTALYDAATMEKIDLCSILKKETGDSYEMNVLVGSKEKTRISSRIVCLRVDKKIAEQRRRRLHQNAKKKGRTVSKTHLYMAGWILMVTNIPREWLPMEMVRPLYSLRWQIELLFKQLKSVLAIHKSATGNESRLRCEILGKLIVAILVHRIHADANIDHWNKKKVEISMDKLYKRIKERAFSLMQLLCKSLSRAARFLNNELNLFMKNCRKLKQKSRLTTLKILDCYLTCQKPKNLEIAS